MYDFGSKKKKTAKSSVVRELRFQCRVSLAMEKNTVRKWEKGGEKEQEGSAIVNRAVRDHCSGGEARVSHSDPWGRSSGDQGKGACQGLDWKRGFRPSQEAARRSRGEGWKAGQRGGKPGLSPGVTDNWEEGSHHEEEPARVAGGCGNPGGSGVGTDEGRRCSGNREGGLPVTLLPACIRGGL